MNQSATSVIHSKAKAASAEWIVYLIYAQQNPVNDTKGAVNFISSFSLYATTIAMYNRVRFLYGRLVK